MNRSVLFLDLATTTGWAEGDPGGRALSGSIRLGKGGDPGEVGFNFMKFMASRMAFRPARVIYEMPFIAGLKNANTTMVTWGLAFTTVTICKSYGVRCQPANLNTIRKEVLGFVPRKDGVKESIIAHCRSLGYEPADDNAADAILGWLYACAVLDPKAGISTTPLFQD